MDKEHSKYSKNISNRIARMEGQLRGIKAMVEEDRPCEDILVQLSAVSSAVTSTARLVMEHHIAHCVDEGAECGPGETSERILSAFRQFSKLK